MDDLISKVGHIFKTQKGVALLKTVDLSKITKIEVKKGSLEAEKSVLDVIDAKIYLVNTEE